MNAETIEIRLEGELYEMAARVANAADVPIERLIEIALERHLKNPIPERCEACAADIRERGRRLSIDQLRGLAAELNNYEPIDPNKPQGLRRGDK